jgi:hypothetical protein
MPRPGRTEASARLRAAVAGVHQATLARPGAGWDGWLVGLVGAEHGENDVAAASGQADQAGVMTFALGPLALAGRLRCRVA